MARTCGATTSSTNQPLWVLPSIDPGHGAEVELAAAAQAHFMRRVDREIHGGKTGWRCCSKLYRAPTPRQLAAAVC
jgi:hypothetical protein